MEIEKVRLPKAPINRSGYNGLLLIKNRSNAKLQFETVCVKAAPTIRINLNGSTNGLREGSTTTICHSGFQTHDCTYLISVNVTKFSLELLSIVAWTVSIA